MNRPLNSNYPLIALTGLLLFCILLSLLLKEFISPFIAYNKSLLGIFIGSASILLYSTEKKKIYALVWFLFNIVLTASTSSRSGIIALVTGSITLLLLESYKRKSFKKILLTSVAGSIVLLVTLTFTFKENSTLGRWFIWKNCLVILKEHFWFGVGWGQFRVAYNNQQAEWFVQNGFQNKETVLADTVCFAFNEWLQLAVEIGVPLSLLIISSLVYVYIKAFRKATYHNNTPFFTKKTISAFTAVFASSFFVNRQQNLD